MRNKEIITSLRLIYQDKSRSPESFDLGKYSGREAFNEYVSEYRQLNWGGTNVGITNVNLEYLQE